MKTNWIRYRHDGSMRLDESGFGIFLMEFFQQRRFVDFGQWERGGLINVWSSAGRDRIVLEIKEGKQTRVLELGEISITRLADDSFAIHVSKFVSDPRLTARLTEFEQAVREIMDKAKAAQMQAVNRLTIAQRKFVRAFEFDANAPEVVATLFGEERLKKVELTRAQFACELELYCVTSHSINVAMKSLYVIFISATLREFFSKEEGRQSYFRRLEDVEIAEIRIKQERPGQCQADLRIEADPYQWKPHTHVNVPTLQPQDGNTNMTIGTPFVLDCWQGLIETWLKHGSGRSLEQLSIEPSGADVSKDAELCDKIKRLYKEGKTDPEIAAQVWVGKDRVKQIRHKLGLKAKPRGKNST